MFSTLKLSLLFTSLISILTAPISIPLKLISTTKGKHPILREMDISLKRNFGNLRKLKTTVHGKIDVLESRLFAAELLIGTNSQLFNVVLDTGSVVCWIPLTGSDDGSAKIEHHYNPSSSETSSKTNSEFKITYGTGSTEGYYYQDNVKFMANSSFNLEFGGASKLNFDVTGADGIMGLGKKYDSSQRSALITLKNKGIVPSASFSFKYDDGTLQMYIGDEHEDFSLNNTATCQLLSRTTYDALLWTCKLYNFGLINSDRTKNATASAGYNLLFDTGSNICILPTATLDKISNELSQFNCEVGTISENTAKVILCKDQNSLPDIFIEVGDNYIFLDHTKFFYRTKLDGQTDISYLLNVYFQETTMPIIGQPFFTEFHTKFDLDNNVLKFHTENDNAIVFASKKPDNDEADSLSPLDNDLGKWIEKNLGIIVAVAIVVAALILLCIIYKMCNGVRKFIFGSSKKSSQIEGNYTKMGH